jgi:hypothetical protein
MTNDKWKIFGWSPWSGCLRNFSGLNAASAYLHPFGAALGKLDPDGLQIRIEAAGGPIVCMRNVIAELGRFSAYFAAFSHD